jgi:hypothetical protein
MAPRCLFDAVLAGRIASCPSSWAGTRATVIGYAVISRIGADHRPASGRLLYLLYLQAAIAQSGRTFI